MRPAALGPYVAYAASMLARLRRKVEAPA